MIDGTLIPVQKPPAAFHPDENIFAQGFLTSKHSRWSVFANSHIKRILEQDNGNESALLLGDSGSGISRNLMVPYHECGNDRESAYNVMFTRERVVIERLIIIG